MAASNNITSLHTNDVLLGRGTGPNTFIGNQRFRNLVETHKEEYLACQDQDKSSIAHDVVDEINKRGGRFVKQVKNGKKNGEVYEEGIWQQVNEGIAMEKVKQALREHKTAGKNTTTEKAKESPSPVKGGVVVTPMPQPEVETSATITVAIPSSAPPPAATALHVNRPAFLDHVPAVDARLLLFQPALLQQPQSSNVLLNPSLGVPPSAAHLFGAQQGASMFATTFPSMYNSQAASMFATTLPSMYNGQAYFQGILPDIHSSLASISSLPPSHWQQQEQRGGGTFDASSNQSTAATCRPPTEVPTASNKRDRDAVQEVDDSTDAVSQQQEELNEDEVAAAFLLTSLAIKDRPTITEEERKREVALLPVDEKAAALADIFGKMNVNETPKKAKRDLDKGDVKFLISQMRHAIDKIPEMKKQALLEATHKCRPEEFSDSRLEKFLRCEGLNAELAAQRFVGYWEKRKEVFGDEKFTMRLTLSEALKDDIVAIEAAVYCLLPYRDSSGRQLMYLSPPKKFGQGYSADSLFRAMWYVAEVASSENDHARSGVIEIAWREKDVTLWDYHPRVYDRLLTYLQKYWPIRTICSHICCPPKIACRVLLPILTALVDPFMRSRMQVHDVPPDQILAELSNYGIEREMLPKAMGGSLELYPSEWIANRRAVELEEVS